MIELRHVAARLYNRPLLLTPSTAETISAYLLARINGAPDLRGGAAGENDAGETRQVFSPQEGPDGSIEVRTPRASRFYGDYVKGDDDRPLPFRSTPEGVAIITAVGEFVNRGAWVGASSGLISYEGFTFQLRRAAANSRTSAILLDLESPGGEGVGAFEAAAAVREVAQQKPVVALVNGMAASAAYAIASGASRIVTIPTGLVGSIGVVLLHLDFSKMLAEAGVKPTLIFAGNHKVDGNIYEPLPAEVRKDMQALVAGFYDQFVETVAAGRNMAAADVRKTQARLFVGEDAVAAGLADAVGTFESVLTEMATAPAGRKGVTMNDKSVAAAAATAGISQADHDAAVAKAMAAAKARVNEILTAKEAVGRGAMAQHLAFHTEMSAADAVALLAVAPKEAAEKSSRLDGKVPSPNVGAAETRGDAQSIAASWDHVIGLVNRETAANANGRHLKH